MEEEMFAVPEGGTTYSKSNSSVRGIEWRSSESGNSFSSSVGTLHVKEATVKLLHCAYCSFTHKESKSMVSHMSSHTGKKPYKCRSCEFSSNWKEVVARHAKARHNGSNLDVDQQFKYSVSKFICRVSDDRGELNLQEVTFPEDIVKGDSVSMEEEEEDAVVNIESSTNSVNGDGCEVESTPSVVHSNSKVGLSGFRGGFKCELCPFRAEKAFHIDFHLKRHQEAEGADFKCPHCPYWVNAKKSLMRHIYLHEVETGAAGPPEEVDYSQEVDIESESNLGQKTMVQLNDVHMMQGMNGSGHKLNKRATSKNRCDACPFVAGTKTQLLYHKQFHRPNRAAYKCPHCTYSVSHQHLLNQHLKVHFGGESSSNLPAEQDQSLVSRTNVSKVTESSSSNIPFILVDSSDGSSKVKMYHCRYCSVTNRKKSFIMAHEQLHSQGHNHVYRCCICIFSTRIKNKYASHVDGHNEDNGQQQPFQQPESSKKLRETLLSGPPKGTAFGSSINHSGIANSGSIKSSNQRRMFSYVCPDCPAAFKSPGDLKIHSVFHGENDYPHSCPYCTYKAKNKPQLCKHLYVHTSGYVSKRVHSYPQGKHVSNIHSDQVTGKQIEAFRASSHPRLGQGLPPPPPLYVPNGQHSSNPTQSTPQVSSLNREPVPNYDLLEQVLLDMDFWKMNESSYNLNLGKRIEKYVQQLCAIERYETISYLDKLKSKAKHRFDHRCPSCPASFGQNQTLKFHISLHEYQGLLECDSCSYSVDYDESIKAHSLLHSILPSSMVYTYNHRCPQCPAAFSKPSRLEKHLTLHGSNAKWKCDHCDYAVPYAATLVKHRAVHGAESINTFDTSSKVRNSETKVSTPTNSLTPSQSPRPMAGKSKVPKEGEKLYHCDRCPYSHSRRDAVQSHQKRHKSDGDVGNGKMCPYCDYVCLQPSYLREHIRLHTGSGSGADVSRLDNVSKSDASRSNDLSKVDMMDLNKDLELEEEEIVGKDSEEDDFDTCENDLEGVLDTSMKVECEVDLRTSDNEEEEAPEDNFDNFDLNIDWRDSFTDTHMSMLATPAEVLGSRKSWDPFQNNSALVASVSKEVPKVPRKRIRKPKIPVDPNSTETFGDLAPTRIRRQYTCEECSFRTVNPREFLYHRRDDHQAKVKIVECPYCVYACQYFQKLQRHILLVHKLETSTTPPKATFPSGNPAASNLVQVDGSKKTDSVLKDDSGVKNNSILKSGSVLEPDGDSINQNIEDESSQGELRIAEDNTFDDSTNGGHDDGDEENFDLGFDWRDNSDIAMNMLATPDQVVARTSASKWNPIHSNQNQEKPKPTRKRIRKPKMPLDPNSTVTFGDLAPTRVRRQYNCEQCNFRTVNPREFLYHRRDDHQAKVKIVECPYCVYACQYFQKLQRHILLVHKLETSTTPPKAAPKVTSGAKSSPIIVKNPVKRETESLIKSSISDQNNGSEREDGQDSEKLIQSPTSDQNNGSEREDSQNVENLDSSTNEVEYEVEFGTSDMDDGVGAIDDGDDPDASPRSLYDDEEGDMDEEIDED